MGEMAVAAVVMVVAAVVAVAVINTKGYRL
jgi:hypothetical protein